MDARETADVYAAIENWAWWCQRWRELLPGCPTNWQLIDQAQYKNCYQTTEEKHEQSLNETGPDDLAAAKVETIVRCLHGRNKPLAVALRINYVDMPEKARHDLGLTLEQWNERRARHATRRAGWYFSPAMYLEAVNRAVYEVEALL